jgi:hypothetical protein
MIARKAGGTCEGSGGLPQTLPGAAIGVSAALLEARDKTPEVRRLLESFDQQMERIRHDDARNRSDDHHRSLHDRAAFVAWRKLPNRQFGPVTEAGWILAEVDADGRTRK